ncbi:hypothetical protein AV521_41685 [Streptomyces sp. IMTB 2501]|uniref:DUF6083 domain-containing protein n=1 Tax=Streptomyces sp. IMTB 2501 TaxID=1776340 RepID=UPI00096E2966|nr:DUF6083 domain-containing protein [Streptomyces sp. IMTB 2501]OLZ62489.1 hypothetical protein AV521_41685 [Streptomyces sp. IMTB 2501]
MGGHDDRSIPSSGSDEQRQRPPGVPRPWENTDRAQALLDGATGPEPPSPPHCPHCGLAGERRPTCTGQHVPLEPGLVLPAHLVPGGHRWHIDSNGVAWNGGFAQPLARARCRIPHQLACPGLSLDEIRPWRWLSAVREENARRARRRADEEGCPKALPDAG